MKETIYYTILYAFIRAEKGSNIFETSFIMINFGITCFSKGYKKKTVMFKKNALNIITLKKIKWK